ncbi:MAG: hypothetical protein EOQ86_06520 [Mesorhizobium sp.]|uniref:hypothetical protein n=1 Tax=Mesorhizobium sp. TaxID=1871066 RepID=UPI000FE4E2EB|nr:hypothetical protein [Mesorhizobium sp.]RWH81217.1 MAG: hypothetical protein EOQ85_09270 [Mesorhizobium sp.]RWH85810.1 MAG: hypothetical protein EOQ86_06520 [Mesorhizobium sp.]RWH91067.1 MAG: hypothetical protein EOQ87_10175 [Mesorhizobium sp.]RWH99749.1 MAG: hypothetical protein EOQ88_10280 [Mesorhizobium sp.]RWI04009.1 MAG: hypothetical protein EOQ89_10630 [Mesorhizobium sp.]
MRHWPVRQVFVFFLTVFVTAGVTSSYVEASDMAAKMASDMGAMDNGDCKACLPTGGSNSKAMICISACVTPVLAVLPQAEPLAIGEVPISFTALHQSFHGTEPPPNPGPPRTTDIV